MVQDLNLIRKKSVTSIAFILRILGVSQQRATDPLELELKHIVSYPMWVLAIKVWSSARVVDVINHRVIIPPTFT